MKFSYKFSNVLGSVYEKGNLIFSPNDNCLLSPCGNKIMVYDLKNNKNEALPFEIQYNICRIALGSLSSILLIATEQCQLFLTSMISNTILHRKDFKQIGNRINDLKFSPNQQYYAVCGSEKVLVYLTPGYMSQNNQSRQLFAFKIHRIFTPSSEESTSINWSHNSQLLMVTCKDFSIRIYSVDPKIDVITNVLTLTGHNDLMIGSFFSGDSTPLNLYSLTRNGQMFVWKSNLQNFNNLEEPKKLNYSIERKKYFFEDVKDKNLSTRITSFAYHNTKLLIIGLNEGTFMLYQLPDIALIHSLQLSNRSPISTLTFDTSGHWVAIGSTPGLGNKYDFEKNVSSQTQLIVWEWQSESFILKQSGYSNRITNSFECFAFSPDASMIVTGGTDGRIKVWNLYSGFCLSTFTEEHKGPVTAVEFVSGKNGKVFLSCSLDGTVKAFDLNRYRCFRTLAAPNDSKPAQFISLAVDRIGGDFIAAGSHNFFEIFLWSLKTGRLLEMLTGHEGPVSGLKFSPTSNLLYSCSWDSTVRIWNLYEGANCTREVIKLGSDALGMDIRQDGVEFAVATLNGNISFFDAQNGDQLGIGIEGKQDLGIARYISKEVNERNRFFSTICYSIDGEYLIAGGKSKLICIYNIKQKLLIKRFQISNNLSLDGFSEFISKRKIQEFGFNLAVLKHREDNSGLAPIALPGVIKSDCADRQMMSIVAVHQIRFSPTMRSFALASTEGVLIYTLDKSSIFDPFELDSSITVDSMRKNLLEGNYAKALIYSLKLNNIKFVQEVVESTPQDQIELVISSLSVKLVSKLLEHLAKAMGSTIHLEFYMKWINVLLLQYTTLLKQNLSTNSLSSTLVHLHQIITRHQQDLMKITNHNNYLMKFIKILSTHNLKSIDNNKIINNSDDEDSIIELENESDEMNDKNIID